MWGKITVIGFAVLFASFFGWQLWMASIYPDYHSPNSSTYETSRHENKPKTSDELVAEETWWLTFFTGALVITSVIGWIFLYRADRTASTNAEAALQLAEAAKSQAEQMTRAANVAVQQREDMLRSIKATEDSATAAAKSAKIAEDGLIKRERAFVFVKEFRMLPVKAPPRVSAYLPQLVEGDMTSCRISVVWGNSGETPARRVKFNHHFKQFDREMPADFGFPTPDEPKSGVLGPNATVPCHPIEINIAELTNILRRQAKIYIWGWMDYDDIFDNTPRHRTEFCVEVGVDRLDDGQLFIGFPLCGKFNGADDECLHQPSRYEET